ncbi:MAG: YheU family protein [Bdellovibrionota bacterium]
MTIINIDYKKLSDEALTGIIKEFIFEQTMNLSLDLDMDKEISKVKALLNNNKAKILFDDETEDLKLEVKGFVGF